MEEKEPKYRWATAREWLVEAHAFGPQMTELIKKLDSDDIQDVYQDEMMKDGYFIDLNDPIDIASHLEEEGEDPFLRARLTALGGVPDEPGCDEEDDDD